MDYAVKVGFYSRLYTLEADLASTEWMLNKKVLDDLCRDFFSKPSLDLFASKLNCQVNCHILWTTDKNAYDIDVLFRSLDPGPTCRFDIRYC